MSSNHQRRPIRHYSIVTPIELDASLDENLPTTNANFHDPLINSAVITPNCTNDEEIARLQQEQLYAQSIANSRQPPVASSIDMRPLAALAADAALARRLQEEEYTRKSIVAPNRSYPSRGSSSNNHRTTPTSTVHRSRTINTDAELAAQLQEEENKKQRQQRLHAPTRSVPNQTNNRLNASEIVPIPPFNRNRQQPTRRMWDADDDESDDNQPSTRPTRNTQNNASSNRNNNNNNNRSIDIFSFFQPFMVGLNRGTHRNLEQTDDDFGPDDYENLLELDKSVDHKPLTNDQINRLPTEKFRRTAAKTAEECTCNICWDEFENDQVTRRLPCLHSYHKDCIDKWLKTNNTCPICRISANQ